MTLTVTFNVVLWYCGPAGFNGESAEKAYVRPILRKIQFPQ